MTTLNDVFETERQITLNDTLDALVRASGEIELRIGAILEKLNPAFPNEEILEVVPKDSLKMAQMVLDDVGKMNELLAKIETELGIV